jgi:chlorobactene lauroyltransferase
MRKTLRRKRPLSMITARKNPMFMRLFGFYAEWLTRRAFHAVWMRGEQAVAARPPLPTVLYCNHACWWDPMLALLVTRRLGLNSFMMAEEKQLRKYQFFRRIGAFSIERSDPRDVMRSLHYACELLNARPPAALWIYPQGEILPQDLRPLRFLPGVAHILKRVGETVVIPVAYRYEFTNESRPEAFLDFGPAEIVRGAHLRPDHIERLATLQGDVWKNKRDGFTLALRGSRSVNIVYEEWKKRLFLLGGNDGSR